MMCPRKHPAFRHASARWTAVSLLFGLAIFGGPAASAGDTSGSEIVIGEYGSMTGAQATFGSSMLNGVNLAVSEINAAGGIDGKKLKVVSYDDEGKADGALNVAKKLVDDHPVAAIGEVASTLSISAAPVFNQAHIPMISPSSTNPAVTVGKSYIFRVCFIDPFQGFVAAKFAAQSLHAKRAAVLTDVTSDYSHGLSDVFTQNFPKMGGKIVDTETYLSTDVDCGTQLKRIRAAHPDVLYVPGYYPNIGPIARQARRLGLTAVFLGGDGWDSPKLIEGAGGPGKALEGAYFTNHWSGDDPASVTQAFVTRYRRKYGHAPDAIAALSFDAVGVLADALHRIGAPEGSDYASAAFHAKLRDALAETKDYQGITGGITLDRDRNAVKSAVILKIKGNGTVFAARVWPTP